MKKFICITLLLLFHLTMTAQEVSIMTYNIRYDNPDDGVNAWPNRKQKVFELIKKYDADIIGVQEALKHQLTDIEAALPGYKFIGVGRDDGKEKGEYSAILYKTDKFEVADISTSWLSETPNKPGSKSWDAAITRVVTTAKFTDTKSKRSFYVLNTHFDHIGKEARRQSAVLLKKKLTSLPSVPAIVTGDFNCARDEAPYQEMTSDKNLIVDPAPANSPGTFCSFERNSIECRAIDYIFHTPHWKTSDYKVIQDNDGKYYPSDHLPVMATMSLK